MKFYLDTSIFGGLFDKEFEKPTYTLFDFIENKRIKIIYSNILERELQQAPTSIRLNVSFSKNVYKGGRSNGKKY